MESAASQKRWPGAVAWLALALLAALIAVSSLTLLPPLSAAISLALGAAMLAIAVFDARHFIVPDPLSLPAIPAGLVATGVLDDGGAALALEHVLASAAASLILLTIRQAYWIARGREGLGLGDVKLAAVAGAWVGFAGLAPVLLLACIAAISWLIAANMRDLGALKAASVVPFGAYLAPSIWAVWFAQRTGFDFGALPFLIT
jgi:leader peptidase (prepilin peptidase) / N-methyltransferase